ncbi:MAG TPA: EF-hand domain-containing protein [Casimicrobiaceae bacterium]
MKRFGSWAPCLLLLVPGLAAGADARTEYYERAATRDMALFRALDVDHDGAVTRLETQGDLDFGPRLNDMDINRDGVVTQEELQRYIAQHYGVQVAAERKP